MWMAILAALSSWPALLLLLLTFLIFLASQPLFILLSCLVLKLCGVSKEDRASWALKQAGKARGIDLVRAIRGKDKPPTQSSDQPPAAS
jgi:hypothetical protein